MPTLHTIVPCFNEPYTLAGVVDAVVAAPLPAGWERRVLIVDDASDSAGLAQARQAAQRHAGVVALIEHAVNRGKGAAVRTAFREVLARDHAMDSAVIIHDADLEYDPRDHARLLEPLSNPLQRVDAVYGNRFHAGYDPGSWRRRIHRVGNGLLTSCSNLTTGYRLHDMECCFKVMRLEMLAKVLPLLTEDRFGIEPQWTAALARVGATITEVDVSYCARGFAQGKKIGWRDAIEALRVMWRDRPRQR